LRIGNVDEVTFVFALSPPAIAILLSLFASVSDAYIEKESGTAAQEYARVGLNAEIRNSIRNLIFRISKGSLLISNCIATSFNAGIGLFGAIYFLPNNYLIIFVAIMIVPIFMLYILKIMVRYGVKDLYIQRVRRTLMVRQSQATYAITYGAMIDRAMVMMNIFLMAVVVFVYIFSARK
jgi:hypothetical protein